MEAKQLVETPDSESENPDTQDAKHEMSGTSALSDPAHDNSIHREHLLSCMFIHTHKGRTVTRGGVGRSGRNRDVVLT